MTARGATTPLLALLGLALLGGDCGGGSGGGGKPGVRAIQSPDPRCAPLSSPFPSGLDYLPGDPTRAWVLDFAPPTLVPFELEPAPPVIGSTPGPFPIPFDSDGDGRNEGSGSIPFGPVPDDVVMLAPDLALVTASGYEAVLFFDPTLGALRSFRVSVPDPPFARRDNPFLPEPGAPAEPRTGISTLACVRTPPGALDSRGDPVASVLPALAWCDPTRPSYYASFTAGAAIAGGHLFVVSSNLGDDAGGENTQYLPGSVLVYDVDLAASPPTIAPDPDTPVVLTSGFNPTHATAYRANGRDLVLVTLSGPLGIRADDPGTPEIESGAIALGDAAVDVIDAQSLAVVATLPLGPAALASAPAIDPNGRVAFFGSSVDRTLVAVDLEPLRRLPPPPAPRVVLDGSQGENAVIFDARDPFRIPARVGGAPADSCPGFVSGVAFDTAGETLYASEHCDGTLAEIAVDLSGSPPAPVPAGRFQFVDLLAVAAPLRSDTLGQPRAPGQLRVRAGAPGSEIQLLMGQPGLLCGF